MEGQGSKLVYGIGLQLLTLAITFLVIFGIVWVASKAWKTGQNTRTSSGASSTAASSEKAAT